jgi:hypothetical protein
LYVVAYEKNLLRELVLHSMIARLQLIFLLALPLLSSAQPPAVYKGLPSAVWPKLYRITYGREKTEQHPFGKPMFSPEAKALSGKQVTLPGFMVPFESGLTGNHFMLSSLPINACFFCGSGGPETVVEVFLARPIRYTDKPIEVKGTLVLNDQNAQQMIYVLENASFLGEIEF